MKKIISILLITFLCFSQTINTFAEYKLNEKEQTNLEKIAKNISKKGDNYRKKMRAYFAKLEELLKDPLYITVIDDKRCTNCGTNNIIEQLKTTPGLENTKITKKDFSEKNIEKYLKDNEITKLPAFIFSTNDLNDNGRLKQYLSKLKSGEYYLEIGANFDPFIKRSDRGFLVLDKDILKKIKENGYTKGENDTKITILEYSDLECPYCAKLYNEGTLDKIEKNYTKKVNFVFNHYPLEFHQNAMNAARVLECVGKQLGKDKFYSLINISYSNTNSEKNYLTDEAIKLGAKKENLESCIKSGDFDKKIKEFQDLGTKTFSIAGTPGNVIINNDTLEYEVIVGAYPYENFESIIEKLLK